MSAGVLTAVARALATGEDAPDDASSERILDAALALSAASGVRNMTMEDVARRAGVGRMTVYRRFGDRARLVQALAVRETRRCLAELEAAADPGDPIADQVAAGFATSVRLAREHPLLARLARVEPDVVLDTLTAEGSGAFGAAVAFLAHRLRQSQDAGVLGVDVDVDVTAELLVRLSFSFVLVPDSGLPLDDEERLRDIARRHLAPLLAS